MGSPSSAIAGLTRMRRAGLILGGATLCVIIAVGCGESFNVDVVVSPDVPNNEAPTIEIFEPNEDLAISQGDSFVVRWTDRDPDNNARIKVELIQTEGSLTIPVASNISENDNEGDDFFIVDSSDLPFGEFFVRTTIQDFVNQAVTSFANEETTGNRVRVTITQQGLGRSNRAPRVFVAQPAVNIGVAQNDQLEISIQPNAGPPPVVGLDPGPAGHYDQDGDSVNVAILLDLDQDPGNDNFLVDDDPGNILLDRAFLPSGSFDAQPFNIEIDVQDIPVRRDGLPYYVRASATDGLNIVHAYGTGTVHVLEFVEGSAQSNIRTIDLANVGKTLAGARFQGFNALANLGSKMATIQDIDSDGVEDVVILAQFGNPRNLGNIGEAYVIFGTQARRFGGTININTLGIDDPNLTFGRVRGAVFNPHHDRLDVLPGGTLSYVDPGDTRHIGMEPLDLPYTMGITDVVAISNWGGNGTAVDQCALPELAFGLPHTEYMATGRDDDLGDNPDCPDNAPGCLIDYCYPDTLPNNYSTDFGNDPTFATFFGEQGVGGVSEQRMGQVPVFFCEDTIRAIGDGSDTCNTLIAPTRQVFSMSETGGSTAGVRFGVAMYDRHGADTVDPINNFVIDPLNSHYGYNVGVLPDLDLNFMDELIISAPRNELEVQSLQSSQGSLHPHLQSRLSRGNVTVFLGQDWSGVLRPDTANVPYFAISPRVVNPGSCDPMNAVPRTLETEFDVSRAGTNHTNAANNVIINPGWFRVLGENPTDKLGFARTAGDFNQDGTADLMCGAPFADPRLDLNRDGVPDEIDDLRDAFDLDEFQDFDAGKVYILYLRHPFGNIDLVDANNINDLPPDETDGNLFARPRMLRIFGESVMDHLGQRQEPAGDVDGDLVSDVVIASQDINGLGMVDNGAVAIVYGGQQITGDRRFLDIATPRLSGTIFYGTENGDLAGADISANGDFNGDGLGDILISAPGENRSIIGEDRPRVGTVYLILGGRHLVNKVFTLSQVGSAALPGLVMVGPYQENTPDSIELDRPVFVRDQDCTALDSSGNVIDSECLCNPEIEELCSSETTNSGRCCELVLDENDAPAKFRVADGQPSRVGFVGDLNADGFDDIMVGNPTSDLFDPAVPVEARRRDTGEVYLIYGNNFGANTIVTGPATP